ncbi:MAG: carbon-nitrogen hydrolase family protein [Clostridiales bacterium]|nr:carbon-nitrogen hydrolase family protein [Clostridiales bacterium]
MKGFTIAMVQMRVIPGAPEVNLRQAADLIAQSAREGASLALLPEALDLGWTSPGAASLTGKRSKASLKTLREAARANNIWVVAGLTQRKGGRVYNTAVLISDKGSLVGRHRKISLVQGVEDSLYTPGSRLEVYDTLFGRLAIPVCADNLMPSIALGEALGLMGADLLLSPCSWAVPPERLGQPYGQEWYEPYAHLSRRFNMTVIGVSNVGEVAGGAWNGWLAIGNSIAMGPGGQVLKVMPYGPDAQDIALLDL